MVRIVLNNCDQALIYTPGKGTNMKKNHEQRNNKKARAIYDLIRNMGNGLRQQYDELVVAKRVEQKP